MNDALCEHIVARKSKPMDFIIRILIIVVICISTLKCGV